MNHQMKINKADLGTSPEEFNREVEKIMSNIPVTTDEMRSKVRSKIVSSLHREIPAQLSYADQLRAQLMDRVKLSREKRERERNTAAAKIATAWKSSKAAKTSSAKKSTKFK